MIYDPGAGQYAERIDDPLTLGSVRCPTRCGPVDCRPAFERYAALCRDYPPECVARITGVPAEQIMATARLLWERRPVAYFHWTGLEQHTNASQTVRALSLLYALTGCWDAPGGNVRPTRPASNDLAPLSLLAPAQRAKTLGLAERPLGPARLGWATGADLYRAILHGTPYPVRGMVGFGANLLLSQPDAGVARAALSRLDFLVYADLFLTPTAALADVVLPVSTAWEREGLRVGFGPTHAGERHVQLRRAAVAPRGEVRSDIWITCELAKRLGFGDRFFGGDEDAGHAFMLEPSGVTLRALRERPEGISVPVELRYRRYAVAQGTSAVGFATPSRRVEIYAGALLEVGQAPLPDYVEPAASPVSRPDLAALSTGAHDCQGRAILPQPASQSATATTPQPGPPDRAPSSGRAGARGITADDWVLIETPRATMRARARLVSSLALYVVYAQFGWWQGCEATGAPWVCDPEGPVAANYNALIDTRSTVPLSGTVPLRSSLCEVRRLDSPPA